MINIDYLKIIVVNPVLKDQKEVIESSITKERLRLYQNKKIRLNNMPIYQNVIIKCEEVIPHKSPKEFITKVIKSAFVYSKIHNIAISNKTININFSFMIGTRKPFTDKEIKDVLIFHENGHLKYLDVKTSTILSNQRTNKFGIEGLDKWE